MTDILKGRPKGPNLTTGAIDAVFSAHPTHITIEDLEIGQNISPSHAEWIVDAMRCFDLGTGKLYPQFDPRFRKDNSQFCDKCCYGP